MLIILAAILSAIFRLSAADAKILRKPVGLLVNVVGAVEWRDGDATTPIVLTKSNCFRAMYLGDFLRCRDKSRATIALISRKEWVFTGTQWTLVPDAEPPLHPDLQTRIWVKALKTYTLPAGRQRTSLGLYCPADGSSIRAGSLDAIRWNALQFSGRIRLTLRDKSSRIVIWRQRGIDSVVGDLTSPDFLAALKRQGERHQGELELEASDDKNKRSLTSFRLLSPEQEDDLAEELRVWDKEFSGVLRHIGRASSLRERKLLNEAAAEYDLALELDEGKDSIEVLRQATLLQELTGNFARMGTLRLRLPQVLRSPQP